MWGKGCLLCLQLVLDGTQISWSFTTTWQIILTSAKSRWLHGDYMVTSGSWSGHSRTSTSVTWWNNVIIVATFVRRHHRHKGEEFEVFVLFLKVIMSQKHNHAMVNPFSDPYTMGGYSRISRTTNHFHYSSLILWFWAVQADVEACKCIFRVAWGVGQALYVPQWHSDLCTPIYGVLHRAQHHWSEFLHHTWEHPRCWILETRRVGDIIWDRYYAELHQAPYKSVTVWDWIHWCIWDTHPTHPDE